MPLAATITAFYNFSANTKARASQVNANFDVFRGHIIPIDPNTVSSANNTYDLGSSEYRWRSGYINSLISNTISVAKLGIQNTTTVLGEISLDAATTSAEMVFKLGGTERFRINQNGYIGNNARSSGLTTSAGIGQFASSVGITATSIFNYTSGSTAIANMTLTIQTTGRPVRVGLIPYIGNPATSYLGLDNTSSAALAGTQLRFYRNGIQISEDIIQISGAFVTTTANPISIGIAPSGISIIDYEAPATTNIYHLEYKGYGGGGILYIGYIRMLAYEL